MVSTAILLDGWKSELLSNVSRRRVQQPNTDGSSSPALTFAARGMAASSFSLEKPNGSAVFGYNKEATSASGSQDKWL